jgi:uncharacterized delta-60 repeat protein
MNASNPSAQNDAALDQTFATAGIFKLDGSIGRQALLHGVKAQYSPATERIYFTGQAGSSVNSSQYVLGCLRPNGTLDHDFATNGVVQGDFIARMQSVGVSITLLPDGKILLIGRVISGKWLPALARFSAEGVLDPTFGTETDNHHVVLRMPGATKDQDQDQDQDQHAATDNGDSQVFSTSAVPFAEGKILVVHTYVATHQADTRAYLFLLNSDGSYDTSFNGSGYKQVIYPGDDQTHVKLRGGLIDQDGTIVVCGGLGPTPESRVPLMARYTLKGVLVPGFGTDGFLTPPLPSDQPAEFETVIVQPNKRLLGIGRTDDGHGLLISLESNGAFNIQFNGAKPLLTRLDNNLTSWKAGAMQPDGQIILCGSTKPADEHSKGVVARFNDNGTLDTTFHGGWVGTSVDGITIFNALIPQEDGKILVAGFGNADSSLQGLVLRYHANGDPL